MKQETLNIFAEGLNYDLNPLVTPNNVLTDNVNGTFITFNGNELSLQNDAGNTVINIKSVDRIFAYDPTVSYKTIGENGKPDKIAYTHDGNRMRCWICVEDTNPGESPLTHPGKWREYIVRLSPGFYPLAMKEYGGVLYIVSGRDILRLASVYDLENHGPYAKDDFVNTGLTTIPVKYYKSLKYNNTSALSDATAWEYMGPGNELEDIKQRYNEIEFGSYPSPENYTEEGSDPEASLINKNQIGFPKVLSEIIFSAGEYVMFTNTLNKDSLDIEWITQYHGTNTNVSPHYRFYVAHLYQQLTSGMVDLTSSIDEAYARWYDAGNTDSVHWLFDPTFKFYSPSLYKGKLALSLEIIDLVDYTVEVSSVTFNKTFTVELSVSATFIYNPYTIWVEGFTATIENLYELTGIPTVTVSFVSESLTNDAETLTNKTVVYKVVISNINSINLGRSLKYKVIPKFNWGTSQVNDDIDNPISALDLANPNNQLPASYIEEYTHLGSTLLISDLYTIRFSLEMSKLLFPGYNECDLDMIGFRLYKVIVLTNSAGELIDSNFQKVSTPWAFVYEGLVVPGITRLGEYTVDPNTFKAVLKTWDDPSIPTVNKNLIIGALTRTLVRVQDDSCLADAFINLTINVDQTNPFNFYVDIQQPGSNLTFATYEEASKVIQVRPNLPVIVKITPYNESSFIFEEIDDTIDISTENVTCTYTPIGKIEMFENGVTYAIGWRGSNNLGDPNVTINTDSGYLKYLGAYPLGSRFAQGPTVVSYSTIGNYTYQFSPGTWLLGNYQNIKDTDDYVHFGSPAIIFRVSGTV